MASSRASTPASSQLSSHGSSEFGDDVKAEELDAMASESLLMPPNKRRRLGSSNQSTPLPQLENTDQEIGEISSDSDTSIPSSPSHEYPILADEDPRTHVQVHTCRWDNCIAGDVGNMDNLVLHLHDEHVGTKDSSYACEWVDCARKGTPHASGYALKAHLRSHTKEKPSYCALPECDRSFTRSDALAKHMRTVHETEALRPSDPIPRNYNSAHFKPQRLKLIIKQPANGKTDIDSNATESPPPVNGNEDDVTGPYEWPEGEATVFTKEESALPPSQLFRLLRRQVAWSEQAGKELEAEVQELEKKRRAEWMEKELVLYNLMEAECAVAFMRGGDQQKVLKIVDEDLPKNPLPLEKGDTPWYRSQGEDDIGGEEG